MKLNMKSRKSPKGWDKERVRKVLEHYENQTEEEAVVEDKAAYEDASQTLMGVSTELVPQVRKLIAEHKTA